MGRETDREDTVDTPGGSAPADETKWPTWEDIAKLHRIPSAAAAPDESASDEPVEPDEPTPAEAEVDVVDDPVAEPEAAPESRAVPEPEAGPGTEASAGTEPDVPSEPDPGVEAVAETEREPEPGVESEPGFDQEPEPTADDAAAATAESEPEDDGSADPIVEPEAEEPAGTEQPDVAGDRPETVEPADAESRDEAADALDREVEEADAENRDVVPADTERRDEEADVQDREVEPADAENRDVEPADAESRDVEPADAERRDEAADTLNREVGQAGAEDTAGSEPEPAPEAAAPAVAGDDATVVMAPVADAEEVAEAAEPEPDASDDETAAIAPVSGAAAEPEDETVVVEPVPDEATVTVPESDAAAASDGETAVEAGSDDATTVIAPVGDEPEPAPEPEPPARVSAFPATSSAPAESPRVTAGPVPKAERTPSVLDEFASPPHKRRWPLRLGIAAGIVVLLGGGYVGLCYALADRVPHGATVAGVDVGGLQSAAAVQRLTDQLAEVTTAPIAVTANDQQAQIDPAVAGLAFDAQATVDALTGADPTDPSRLWRQIVGIGEVAPVTAVDEAALAGVVSDLGEALLVEPVDGAIVFADGEPHATPAVDGWALDEPGAVRAISDGWLVGSRPLSLPTASVEPDITQAETDQVLADVARRVSGGPVTAQVGDLTASLDPATLAANASFVPRDGTLVLQMNGEALRDAVLGQLPGLLTPATDATFAFENGAPVIVPGEAGTTLDPVQVAAAIADAASKPTGRQAQLALVPTDPAETTAALEALGITEVVSEFSTPLTSDRVRDVNIRQGVANITGVLVRPGEEFSLTEALGPIDAAHGFVQAGAIVNGVHTDAWGGGLSQVSTTTYNAAYLAGFELVEHHPHSEYFSRYPAGREATIFTGQLDMRWKNNTPYGALVQGWVEGREVHVRIWGTKYWTVQSESSERWGIKAPTTVYNQSPSCEPQSAGNPGFSIRVTRKTFLGEELKNTEDWTTTYKPQNQVVCGPPPG